MQRTVYVKVLERFTSDGVIANSQRFLDIFHV